MLQAADKCHLRMSSLHLTQTRRVDSVFCGLLSADAKFNFVASLSQIICFVDPSMRPIMHSSYLFIYLLLCR